MSAPRVSFVSLACPKTLVDSERIITSLRSKDCTRENAPEIDGSVHIQLRRPLRVGDIVTVEIEAGDAYNLHGIAV